MRMVSSVILLLAVVAPARAGEGCRLYEQETFPYGVVWWRIDPGQVRDQRLAGFPEGRTAYLVTAVRPDGILVQNREARHPRLLGWKAIGRSQISIDGRRTWRRGCAPGDDRHE